MTKKDKNIQSTHWRSNGALHVALKSLIEIEQILVAMLKEQQIVADKLKNFSAEYPEFSFTYLQDHIEKMDRVSSVEMIQGLSYPLHLSDGEKQELNSIAERAWNAQKEGHTFSDQELEAIHKRLRVLLPEPSSEVKREGDAIFTFQDIHEPLVLLQSNLSCSVRTVILMIAVELESEVNKFCYFNLGETVSDSIERLGINEKLEVIHRVLGLSEFKGTHLYAGVRALFKWRNAFAHGKCTDMPINSLKKNHLIAPVRYPNSGDEVHEMLELLHHFLLVRRHLQKISKHSYTSSIYGGGLGDIERLLWTIQTFKFEEGQLVGRENDAIPNFV